MDRPTDCNTSCSAEYCIPVAFDQLCRARKLNENLNWAAFVKPASQSAPRAAYHLPYDPVIEDMLFVCFDRALTNGAEALDVDGEASDQSGSVSTIDRLRCQGHNVDAVVGLLTHRDASRSSNRGGQEALMPKAVAAAMLQYLVRLCKYAPPSFLLQHAQRILEAAMPTALEYAIAPEEVLLAAFKNIARRVPPEYWTLTARSEATAVHRWRWLTQRLTEVKPMRRVALVLADRVLREPVLPLPMYGNALLRELSIACTEVIATLTKSDGDYSSVQSLRRRCNDVQAASNFSKPMPPELSASTPAPPLPSASPPSTPLDSQDSTMIDRETLLAFMDDKNAQLECEVASLKAKLAVALEAQKVLDEVAQRHTATTEALDAEVMSCVPDPSTRSKLRRAISNLVNRVMASS